MKGKNKFPHDLKIEFDGFSLIMINISSGTNFMEEDSKERKSVDMACVCHECGKVLGTQGSLVRHVKMVHLIIMTLKNVLQPRKKRKKMLKNLILKM